MRRTTRIAVIGAGIGGMTVAGLLQRRGFRVQVYEQAATFSRIGAGIHLSPNVMLVMRHLGIEQALSDIALHPDAFVSRQWDSGEILFELPFGPALHQRPSRRSACGAGIGTRARHGGIREEAVAHR
jgi:6-hydroxynicotinate 3-monooxygenase